MFTTRYLIKRSFARANVAGAKSSKLKFRLPSVLLGILGGKILYQQLYNSRTEFYFSKSYPLNIKFYEIDMIK